MANFLIIIALSAVLAANAEERMLLTNIGAIEAIMIQHSILNFPNSDASITVHQNGTQTGLLMEKTKVGYDLKFPKDLKDGRSIILKITKDENEIVIENDGVRNVIPIKSIILNDSGIVLVDGNATEAEWRITDTGIRELYFGPENARNLVVSISPTQQDDEKGTN